MMIKHQLKANSGNTTMKHQWITERFISPLWLLKEHQKSVDIRETTQVASLEVTGNNVLKNSIQQR